MNIILCCSIAILGIGCVIAIAIAIAIATISKRERLNLPTQPMRLGFVAHPTLLACFMFMKLTRNCSASRSFAGTPLTRPFPVGLRKGSDLLAFSMLRRSKRLRSPRGLQSSSDGSTPSIVAPTKPPPRAASSAAVPVTPSPKRRRRQVRRKGGSGELMTKERAAKDPVGDDDEQSGGLSLSSSSSSSPSTSTSTSMHDLISNLNPGVPFVDLEAAPEELRPSATLTTGQCFHWKALEPTSVKDETKQNDRGGKGSISAWGTHNATEWIGTIRTMSGESLVLIIRETPTATLYRPLTAVPSNLDLHAFLRSYFQLDVSLRELYEAWSEEDPKRLKRIAQCIPGVRLIDQDPWECLVSFICSSNNNIPRITKMLAAIRREFGKPLLTVGDETHYSFPSMLEMKETATDGILREKCGLGYRSKYILETLRILDDLGGEAYLQEELRHLQDPIIVQEKLCQFCGVGPKVADCVALFSLRQDGAIPVDVHVWNIARRDYDADNELEDVKSITPRVYKTVGDLFRNRFQIKPGWAHSLLFVAELPSFRAVLPQDIVQEMEDFREEEQLRKQAMKKNKVVSKKVSK